MDRRITLDWQMSSRTTSGWLSPSDSGQNSCGVVSRTTWNTTTAVEAWGPSYGAPESWFYYHYAP